MNTLQPCIPRSLHAFPANLAVTVMVITVTLSADQNGSVVLTGYYKLDMINAELLSKPVPIYKFRCMTVLAKMILM